MTDLGKMMRRPAGFDLEEMIRDPAALSTQQRKKHKIHLDNIDLVQHAIKELGDDIVRGISFDNMISNVLYSDRSHYFNALRSRLADAYLNDTSKDHLRKYVDHKFCADLGL